MKSKPAKLSCHTGALAGTEIKITKDIFIGRQPSCDLVLYPHSISGQHARLFFNADDGNYYIEDLGSSNGTWVDRMKVQRPTKLDKLNVISFADDIDFIFHSSGKASSSNAKTTIKPSEFAGSPAKASNQKTQTAHPDAFSPPPSIPEQKQTGRQATEFMQSFSPTPTFDGPPKEKAPPADNQNTVYQQNFTPPPDLTQDKKGGQDKTLYSKSFEAPPAFSASEKSAKSLTLMVNTKGEKAQFAIRPGKNSVGRSSAADITIADPFISSSHAILEVKSDGRIVLEDLGSSNKTYVNGDPISSPVTVKEGTQIKFGPNSDATIVSS